MTAARSLFQEIRLWLLAVIVLLGVGGIVVSASSKSANGVKLVASRSRPVRDDVTVAGCSYEPLSMWAAATLTVVNHGQKLSDYLITVDFENSKGAQLGSDGSATAASVGVGKRASVAAGATLSAAPDKVVCKIASVERSAS